MKKRIMLLASILALVSSPAFALVNWGEDDLNQQLKSTFNRTDGTGLSVGGINQTGASTNTGSETVTGVINANGGVDRSTAAGLAIGATHANAVTITPATTITGAVTNSALTASTALTANSSKVLTSSSTTDTELGYIHNLTSPTGSGAIVAANTPTLITPVLGAATGTSLTLSGALTYQTNLVSAGMYGPNSTVLFSSSTALQQANIPYAIILKAIGGSAGNPENATLLPRGKPGQELVIRVYSVVSGSSWQVKSDTAATLPSQSCGWSSVTFNNIGQSAVFIYLNDTLGWMLKSVGSSAAVALPTVVVPSLN